MSEVGAPGAGAPAPAPAAEPSSVPLPDRGVSPPNPATSSPAAKDGEVSTGQPPSGKERKSIDDSIRDAATKVEAKAEAKEKAEPKAPPKAEAKPAAKPEAKETAPAKASPRERDDGGRFASTQPQKEPAAASQDGQAPHHQPLHRFSAEAKADWDKTPETVKAETHRMHREMEAGLHKYRQDAEAYHQVRDFDQLAKATGTTLPKALANYVTIERQLASDDPNEKWEGIQRVLKRANIDPRQLASAILNQPAPTPDQRAAEQNQRFQAYEQKIAALERQVSGVAQSQHQQQQDVISQKVTAFAEHQPRFDELSAPDLEHSIQNLLKIPGMVPQGPPEQRLAKAYELADRLNPSASRSSPLTPEPRPANNAGQKSIAGSPANGSDPTLPAKKGKHPSIDEALSRAAARYGVS